MDQSNERKLSDDKLDYLFRPVLEDLGYDVNRADLVDSPGSISVDIVSRLISADIVIADVSDLNPNVFYELAIRNAVLKPVIIIKRPDQKPPFDIQDTRAISVDMSNPRLWQDAKLTLKKQVENAQQNPEIASHSILSNFTEHLALNPSSPNIDDDINLRLKSISEDLKSIKYNAPIIQNTERRKTFETFSIPYINSEEMLSISLDKKQYHNTGVIFVNIESPFLYDQTKKLTLSILSPGKDTLISFSIHSEINVFEYPIYIHNAQLPKSHYLVEAKLDSYVSYAPFEIIEKKS